MCVWEDHVRIWSVMSSSQTEAVVQVPVTVSVGNVTVHCNFSVVVTMFVGYSVSHACLSMTQTGT